MRAEEGRGVELSGMEWSRVQWKEGKKDNEVEKEWSKAAVARFMSV